jgi:hypothetical protein
MAVREFVETVMPYILEHEKYQDAQILERMTEPDRILDSVLTWVSHVALLQMMAIVYANLFSSIACPVDVSLDRGCRGRLGFLRNAHPSCFGG